MAEARYIHFMPEQLTLIADALAVISPDNLLAAEDARCMETLFRKLADDTAASDVQILSVKATPL